MRLTHILTGYRRKTLSHIENIQQTPTSISWEQVTHDETGGPYSLIKYQPNSFKVTIEATLYQWSAFCALRTKPMSGTFVPYSIRAGEI